MAHTVQSVLADVPDALEKLELRLEGHLGLQLMMAGISRETGVGYPSVFTRDTVQTLLLGLKHQQEPYLSLRQLRDCCRFLAMKQGTKVDPRTCEEPGKPPHESPIPAQRDGAETTEYAAVDSAPYMILAFYEYWRRTGDHAFIGQCASNLAAAGKYLQTHSDDGLLRDDPRDYGCNLPRLKAHYFRDGGYWEFPYHRQPYPAYYFNANAVMVAAYRALASLQQLRILSSKGVPDADRLEDLAANTVSRMQERFWMEDKGCFASCVYGVPPYRLETVYLDPIWSCNYLRAGDLTPKQWREMLGRPLERVYTPAGYADREPVEGYDEDDRFRPGDQVHVRDVRIWPIELVELADMVTRPELADIIGHLAPDVVRNCLRLGDVLLQEPHPFRECIQYGPHWDRAWCQYQLWTVLYHIVMVSMRRLHAPVLA